MPSPKFRYVAKDGRHWRTYSGKMQLQCRKCAKYRSVSVFDTMADGSFDLICRYCRPKEERVRTRPAPGSPLEGARRSPKKPDHDYVVMAAMEMFPGYDEYPRVTMGEVRANPDKYPGPTWATLTVLQRNAVYARAKELLFQKTGLDIRQSRRDIQPDRAEQVQETDTYEDIDENAA